MKILELKNKTITFSGRKILPFTISFGHLCNQVIKFSITNIVKLNLHAYRIIAIKYSDFSLVVFFPKVFNLNQIIQNKWVNIECKMFCSINGINSGKKYTVNLKKESKELKFKITNEAQESNASTFIVPLF